MLSQAERELIVKMASESGGPFPIMPDWYFEHALERMGLRRDAGNGRKQKRGGLF